jgi:ssRNA-specific RNase YbeY (16S rRNA maturation enzyme)
MRFYSTRRSFLAKMLISIRPLQKIVPVPTSFIQAIIHALGKATDTDDYDICVWLVDNAFTHRMNLADRSKDKPADVLSVPLHPVGQTL